MRPSWFRDSIPLDPLIAPMVFFFQKNGVRTFDSCEGGDDHLYGRPTISFHAQSLRDIDRVARLLEDNALDTSAEVGLMTGFFRQKHGGRYGKVQWIWAYESEPGKKNIYKTHVYENVVQLISLEEIKDITMDHHEWIKRGRPIIG